MSKHEQQAQTVQTKVEVTITWDEEGGTLEVGDTLYDGILIPHEARETAMCTVCDALKEGTPDNFTWYLPEEWQV